MKAKIYPLHDVTNEISINASLFALHIEIILASVAKGVSTIKNIIKCKEIDTTINWCKSFGAIIKCNGDKITIKGTNREINFNNSLFVCNDTSTTAKLMIPMLCLAPQPFGIEAKKEIIDELLSFSQYFSKFYPFCQHTFIIQMNIYN